ncbi:LTA synthase family protein [Enterobacter roggenkampii]|uniref:LTA synthase family protein n=1 Tax=Enterobacter roggenkampii TaxID=1812935 RepID=UPI0015584E8F|nr:alkaline phosphatase family protein [Enterobacter roggenkampii]
MILLHKKKLKGLAGMRYDYKCFDVARINNSMLRNMLIEVFCILIIILFLKFSLGIIGDDPKYINLHEIIRIYWKSAPVILLYLILRLFNARVIFSLYVVTLIATILTFINSTKLSLTGQPLSYNDIVAGSNISLATKYLSYKNFLICFGIVFIGGFILFLDNKIKIHKPSKFVLCLFMIPTLFMALSSYSNAIRGLPGWIVERVNLLNNKYDVNYFSWDWPGNVSHHGLPLHLIQTSIRTSMPELAKNEVKKYIFLRDKYIFGEPKNKTVIFILCESCWYDDDNFKDLYQPLMDTGFVAMRATSPHYGAGTANIEFEMLTGLPSTSKYLSGIIYQEYVDTFKDNVESFPRALKSKGYANFSAHNNNRTFWRRGDVYRKFGFEQFVDITQMGSVPTEILKGKKPWQWQTDDVVLYRSALNKLREKQGGPIFMNLITMGTHGPYPHLNDSGETVYKYEVAESISRLASFSQEVQKLDKDAIIIVYGDHKPALNKYFYEHNIIPKNLFSTIGDKDEDFNFKVIATPLDLGDVPVFIKSNDRVAVANFVRDANKKPYFCLAAFADKYFINSDVFAVKYTQNNGCQNPMYTDYNGYKSLINSVPSWVYAISLFENI